MHENRTLRLRREVLAALTSEELVAVAGAGSVTRLSEYFAYCVTDPVESHLLSCPTPPYSTHC